MSRRKQLWCCRLSHPRDLGLRSVLPLSRRARGSVDDCCVVHATMASNDMHDRNGIFIAVSLPGQLLFLCRLGLAQAGLVPAVLLQAYLRVSVVMFNLLDFDDMLILSGIAYGADPNQTDETVGVGSSEPAELRMMIPLQHCLS